MVEILLFEMIKIIYNETQEFIELYNYCQYIINTIYLVYNKMINI